MCSNVIASQTCKVCAVCARTDPHCCSNISIIGGSAAQGPRQSCPPSGCAHRTAPPAPRRGLCATRGSLGRLCPHPPPPGAHPRPRLPSPPGPGIGDRGPRPRHRARPPARGAQAGRGARKVARQTLLGLVQVAASPRFGLGVGERGGGDTESRALRATGSRSRAGRRGASIPSLREHSSRARSQAAGERQEKLPPAKGSHQIASRLGAPLKAQTGAPSCWLLDVKAGCLWRAGLLASPGSGQLEQTVTRCVSAPCTSSSRAANPFLRKPRLTPRGAAWDRTQVVELQNICSVEKAVAAS